LRTDLSVWFGCLGFLISCAPPEVQTQSKPSEAPAAIQHFKVSQIQANPGWELTADRAQAKSAQQVYVEGIRLRLEIPLSPLEIQGPSGIYHDTTLHLKGPIMLQHHGLQGALAEAVWSEQQGWSGKQLQISGSQFYLQGDLGNSRPPYQSLQLKEVKARFYF